MTFPDPEMCADVREFSAYLTKTLFEWDIKHPRSERTIAQELAFISDYKGYLAPIITYTNSFTDAMAGGAPTGNIVQRDIDRSKTLSAVVSGSLATHVSSLSGIQSTLQTLQNSSSAEVAIPEAQAKALFVASQSAYEEAVYGAKLMSPMVGNSGLKITTTNAEAKLAVETKQDDFEATLLKIEASLKASLAATNQSSFANNVPVAQAQTTADNDQTKAEATGGIVPCTGINCNLCSIGQLMKNIINFLLGISILLAVAMFAYAGFMYATRGTSETRVTKAHAVFKNVFLGFLVAISAWLIVQTIISVVFDGKAFVGDNWYELECSQKERRLNATIGELFGNVVPGVTPVSSVTRGVCGSGQTHVPEDNTCIDSTTGEVTSTAPRAVKGAIGSGSCAPNSAFGTQASRMSCICGAESSGRANAASRSDVMRANGEAFSWGLYQINLTANPMHCPGQATLNCPSAFAGKNYAATIQNRALYDQCVKAAQNVQCNTATAQYLLNNTPKGITNWSTTSVCK